VRTSPLTKGSGTRVRPGRVLVIDDESFVGNALAWTLPEHQVIAVASGKDALDLLTAGRRFDLVLCDVMLNDMTGVELLVSLRRADASQAERVVFMARARLSPAARYLLDGVSNLCIEMPCDIEGLRALVERRIRSPSSQNLQTA
jgi:CheY-like chemotaxis protein